MMIRFYKFWILDREQGMMNVKVYVSLLPRNNVRDKLLQESPSIA
jgi:hypothetical protein